MLLADDYQMDAPLKDFGASVWFDKELTNLCYDALGIPAATIRGLFEYVYKSDRLILYPHIPPTISEYCQMEPVRFGSKRITISVVNGGPRVACVKVNGRKLQVERADSVSLDYDALPAKAKVEIVMEGGWPNTSSRPAGKEALEAERPIRDDGSRLPVGPNATGLPPSMREAYAELLRMQSGAKNAFDKALVSEALRAFEAYRIRAAMKTDVTAEKHAAVLKMHEDAAMNLYKRCLRRG